MSRTVRNLRTRFAPSQRTDIYRAIYGQTTPGARWHIDEAIRANQAAGVWGMASGWTAEQLSSCMIFQDSAGTLPVFALEQPIGLVLDCRYAPGSRGPELVVNGGFDVDTAGWFINDGGWTWAEGRASLAGNSTPQTLQQSGRFVLGKLYEIGFDVTSSGGAIGLERADGIVFSSGSAGRVTTRFFADRTNLAFKRASGVVNGTIDNVSVREIPGLPLTQSSTMARPAASARINRLLATDVLSTQAVTVVAAPHVLSFTGTGTITLSGASTAGPLVGSGASNRVSITFTPTAGSLTLTVSGSVLMGQLELAL
jgi:hypothetical protein